MVFLCASYKFLLTLLLVIIIPINHEISIHALGPIPKKPPRYALSPTYLEYLSQQERTIYKVMKKYEEELEQRMALLKEYISKYESAIKATEHLGDVKPEVSDKEISSNPILAFQMLSRFANEFTALGRHIGEQAEEVTTNAVREIEGSSSFSLPSSTDLDDAISAILRMQYMYNLKSDDIANGILPGVSEPYAKLTTEQCYDVAKGARGQQFYTLALEWLDTTKSRFANESQKEDLLFDINELNDDIQETISEHNSDYKELFEDGHEYLFAKRVRSRDGPRPQTLRNQLVGQYAGKNLLNDTHPEYYQAVYANHIALCNGKNFQSEKEKANLKCFLDSKPHPYWKIKPLKIEVINRDPQILQIHDFMTESWMHHLRQAAYGELEKAPTGEYATPRTAAYSWFPDEKIPQVPISRTVELVTGLNVRGLRAAEALQVAAYTFGGHVDLHFDSKGPDDKDDPKGERLATFLIYLNDVDVAGLTSFPKLGFAVKPTKGSAVLWYTNKRSLEVDNWMLHGACPLIVGHKWIATKWTHANENMITRPCGLSKED